MTATRDPVSVWFDGAARRLLVRAYANRDQWVGVYVAPPSIRQRASAAQLGIWDLGERDRWGEVRWIRAYKRSVYWNLRYYGRSGRIDFSERRAASGYNAPFAASLEWETGRLVRLAGWPTRRRAVRVRLHDGGAAARSAVESSPARDSWVRSGAQSRVEDRDWG